MNCIKVWDVIKKKALFILFFLLVANIFMCTTTTVEADFSIWPGTQTIGMTEGYPEEPIVYKIRVNNKNSYDMIVSSKITKIEEELLTDNYTYLPNLSWISITPEELYIPAGKHRYFNVSLDIPDSEKPLHYNEKWDIRVFFEEVWTSVGGKVDMRLRLGSKILVHTPSKDTSLKASQNLTIFLGMVIGIVAVSLVIIFIKKKKSDLHKKL